MALGTFTLTTAAKQYSHDGTIDLDTDTFKAVLVSSASNIGLASTVYGSLTGELTTANGYTVGGVTMVSPTITGDVWKTNSFGWTAATAPIVARWLVVYKLGTANAIINPILGYFLLDSTPADYTIPVGVQLVVSCDPTNGFWKGV